MKEIITQNIKTSIEVKMKILNDDSMLDTIEKISDHMVAAYKNKKKVLFCGNGGSAADAQHLAAELSGRYYYDRPPLYAEALHVNTSYLTAVANDYAFEEIYARITEAMICQGDILIGMSTSGNSQNVIKALIKAQEKKALTVGFTGKGGGTMKKHCDFIIEIPSQDTPRIQECHMIIGHALCEGIEKALFPK